jgi:hypothetical protein
MKKKVKILSDDKMKKSKIVVEIGEQLINESK